VLQLLKGVQLESTTPKNDNICLVPEFDSVWPISGMWSVAASKRCAIGVIDSEERPQHSGYLRLVLFL
jgi:hypothetical protein